MLPPSCRKSARYLILPALFLIVTILLLSSRHRQMKHIIDDKTVVAKLPVEQTQAISTSTSTPEQPPRLSCGIYYYYHIPKCGGTSVDKWMREMSKSKHQNISHAVWANGPNKPKFQWKSRLQQVENLVKSGDLAKPNTWQCIHHHHYQPGLRFMMPRLRIWRQQLRAQARGATWSWQPRYENPLLMPNLGLRTIRYQSNVLSTLANALNCRRDTYCTINANS